MKQRQYTHLTATERYHINLGYKSGVKPAQIARELGRSTSTITREIERNQGKRGYRYQQAQRTSEERRSSVSKQQLTEFAWCYIEHMLISHRWSPEQISHRLTAIGWDAVPSPEHIYRHIYADKERLVQHLRGRKQYRKRYGTGKQKRGKIPNRRDISERTSEIEQRTRFGDFEGDTIQGKAHQGAMLTLVERRSLYLAASPLPNKTAQATALSCIEVLSKARAQSITFDNGLEFAKHELISQQLKVDIYFAQPYSPWQRGRNENTNGLLRQYFPKNKSLLGISNEEVQFAVNQLNNRPRKSLGWKTPAEVWAQSIIQI